MYVLPSMPIIGIKKPVFNLRHNLSGVLISTRYNKFKGRNIYIKIAMWMYKYIYIYVYTYSIHLLNFYTCVLIILFFILLSCSFLWLFSIHDYIIINLYLLVFVWKVKYTQYKYWNIADAMIDREIFWQANTMRTVLNIYWNLNKIQMPLEHWVFFQSVIYRLSYYNFVRYEYESIMSESRVIGEARCTSWYNKPLEALLRRFVEHSYN